MDLMVILTRGLPASGKSTWSKQHVQISNGSVKRVNKDDLRSMLDSDAWSKSNERFILELRDQIILMALEAGRHIIVDDTNLNPVHWFHISALVGDKAQVLLKDFMDVPVAECIARNKARAANPAEVAVPPDVIPRMVKQWEDGWKQRWPANVTVFGQMQES
jgi:predicted kinase